jgi:carbon starvation protein
VALIAACALHPDTYFAINAKKELAAQFAARSPDLWQLTKEVGEKTLVGRTGGAVSLAVGMTYIFRMLPGMQTLAAYWYHFAIMFEALFILTLVETGTRVARFIFQETITPFVKPALEKVLPEGGVRWGLNILASALCCLAWGYLLFTNDISTIWPMFGIANQLLAAIGLAFGTTYILTHAPKRLYALCTFLPLCFVFTTTMAAGIISVPRFWTTLQPPSNVINAVMTVCMLGLTVVIIAASVWRWIGLIAGRVPVAVAPSSSPASE